MLINDPPYTKQTTPKSKVSTKQIVDFWMDMPDDYSETELGHHFVSKIFDYLGYSHHQIKIQPNIAVKPALKPDYLIYNNLTQSPVLVIEIKRRVAALATVSDANFQTVCETHPLYRDAVGLSNGNNNGIIQYLDITKVQPECLANYGLVLNGDFWQLWRRVDGLIIPMTTIKRINKTNLPKLLKELAKCLQAPPAALITAIWNRKGGVAKTTNTINVAACLALAGKRVLLIDLDPQNDLTTGIGLKADFAPNYFDRAYEKLQLQEPDFAREIIAAAIQTKTYPTKEKNSFQLSLLSADKKHLTSMNDTIYAHHLHIVFNNIIDLIRYKYDYIFIDSSPKHDKLTECLLCTADAILLPIDVDYKSLNHAIDLSQNIIPSIQSMRNKADNFTLGPWNLGLVFSICPTNIGIGINNAINQTIDSRGFTGKQVAVRLKRYDQVSLAGFKSMPVVCWENSPISKSFQDLTKEVFLGHNYISK